MYSSVQFSHPHQFMQIPASELLFIPFFLTEGTNSGRIWISGQECMLVTNVDVVDQSGVACSISVLSGEAMLLHGSGVITCACSKLW